MTTERAVLRIRLPPMHPGQLEVARHPARFRVLAAGRRWGKTRLGALLCLVEAIQGRRAWWVAPTYKMAQVGWREITRLAAQVPGAEIRRGDLVVLLPTGGEISVRSADRPDTLRGEGLDFLVLDEAAYADPETWSYVLRPALSDRQGRALLISTPKGLNWFHVLFRRGTAGEPGLTAWRFPTSTNPHIPPEEIEEARRQLPELVFRQEYMAEFVDSQGAVFRSSILAAAFALEVPEPPHPGRRYVAGIDLARTTDYTDVRVLDVTESPACLVHHARWQGEPWAVTADRVADILRRYNALGRIDATGVGDPVFEAIRQRWPRVEAVRITAQTKTELVQNLVLALEQGQALLYREPALEAELAAYRAEETASGHVRYTAPEGMHDDAVMALALAVSGVRRIVDGGLLRVRSRWG